MRFTSSRFALPLLAITLFVFAAAQPAGAVATYDAWAASRLVITGITDEDGNTYDPASGDLSIGGSAFIWDSWTDTGAFATADSAGDARVEALDPFDLQPGEGTAQEAGASGSASAPGYSYADSGHLTEGWIDLYNASLTTNYVVAFEFSWSYAVESMVDDPFDESAWAAIGISVSDDPFFSSVYLDYFAESFNGDGPFSDIGTDVFDVFLLAGEINYLSIFTDAQGFADNRSAVPEPATIALLGIGLAGLAGVRRRCR